MGDERDLGGLELDRIIHEKARLKLLTYLASSEENDVSFTEIRDELGLTVGNLSIQLKNLEEAGYVAIHKRFLANRPRTTISLTVRGKKALDRYLDELEFIVASLRKTR